MGYRSLQDMNSHGIIYSGKIYFYIWVKIWRIKCPSSIILCSWLPKVLVKYHPTCGSILCINQTSSHNFIPVISSLLVLVKDLKFSLTSFSFVPYIQTVIKVIENSVIFLYLICLSDLPLCVHFHFHFLFLVAHLFTHHLLK